MRHLDNVLFLYEKELPHRTIILISQDFLYLLALCSAKAVHCLSELYHPKGENLRVPIEVISLHFLEMFC